MKTCDYKTTDGKNVVIDFTSDDITLLNHLKEVQREIKRLESPIYLDTESFNNFKNLVLVPREYNGKALSFNNSDHAEKLKDWVKKCFDETMLLNIYGQLPNGSILIKYENSFDAFKRLSEVFLELSRACQKYEERSKEKEYLENIKKIELQIKEKLGIS